MHTSFARHCLMALLYFIVISVITGLIYPLGTTAIANIFMPEKAEGSLIEKDGVLIGSDNLGQEFTAPHYFWGRPSVTSDLPYNAASSGGSNQSPANPDLLAVMEERAAALRSAHGEAPVPIELLTASSSGLDPHISPAAAHYQVERVAKAVSLDPKTVAKLVDDVTEGRQYGILGEPRVNVLRLNMALDEMRKK